MNMVTRKEMIADLRKALEKKRRELKDKRVRGFKREGKQHRLNVQRALLRRLEAGGLPTNHETAGFYGAGWRCRESLVAFVGDHPQRLRMSDGSIKWGHPCLDKDGVLLGYCYGKDIKRFWLPY